MPVQIKKVAAGTYKISKPYGNDLKPKTESAAKVNPNNSSMPAMKKHMKKMK